MINYILYKSMNYLNCLITLNPNNERKELILVKSKKIVKKDFLKNAFKWRKEKRVISFLINRV